MILRAVEILAVLFDCTWVVMTAAAAMAEVVIVVEVNKFKRDLLSLRRWWRTLSMRLDMMYVYG